MINRLVGSGAEGIILGCTELELLVSESDSPVPTFETTRIHAEGAVAGRCWSGVAGLRGGLSGSHRRSPSKEYDRSELPDMTRLTWRVDASLVALLERMDGLDLLVEAWLTAVEH